MEIQEENIRSLLEEFIGTLTELDHPDLNDMGDLGLGLTLSINLLLHYVTAGTEIDPSMIPLIITPYLKAAYGLGFNRGKAE